jgi:hypothetical protein
VFENRALLQVILVIILVIVMMTASRPRMVWRQVMRVWNQRDYTLKVIVLVVGIYFLYGLYNMYERGMLSLAWYQ